MTLPTHEEIDRALAEIRERGPGAPETNALALLAIKDSSIRQIITRMADGSIGCGGNSLTLQAALTAAYIAGLNLGLTLKELAAHRSRPVSTHEREYPQT
jgi:hypothetical protein